MDSFVVPAQARCAAHCTPASFSTPLRVSKFAARTSHFNITIIFLRCIVYLLVQSQIPPLSLLTGCAFASIIFPSKQERNNLLWKLEVHGSVAAAAHCNCSKMHTTCERRHDDDIAIACESA